MRNLERLSDEYSYLANTIAPGAIGYATCEKDGTYSQPKWIDCSVTDPTPDQELSSAVIATSDPDSVTADTVTSTVTVMTNVSSQDSMTTDVSSEIPLVEC